MSVKYTIVTCAIIEKKGKILIARRAADQKLAGKWEFPGGKVGGLAISPSSRMSARRASWGGDGTRRIHFAWRGSHASGVTARWKMDRRYILGGYQDSRWGIALRVPEEGT